MKKKIIPKRASSTVPTWLLSVQQDPRTGDHFIILPNGLMDRLSWKTEDFVMFTPLEDGSIKVSKVQKKK